MMPHDVCLLLHIIAPLAHLGTVKVHGRRTGHMRTS